MPFRPLRRGENPRSNPRHRERGPKRFTYTYEDIARVAGLAVETVRKAATGSGRRFDPRDLGSVVAWLQSSRRRRRMA